MRDPLLERLRVALDLVPPLIQAVRRGVLTPEELEQKLKELGLPEAYAQEISRKERIRLLGH